MKKILLLVSLIALLTISACTQSETEPDDFPVPPDPQEFPDDPSDPFSPVDNGAGEAPDLPEVVAVINGDEILGEQVLDFQLNMQMQGQAMSIEQAIEQLLMQKVLFQEAVSRGFDATVEDVENMFIEQGESIENIREILESQGISYDLFIEEQIQSLVITQLIEDISSEVEISDEEARQIYDEQSELLGDERPFEEAKDEIKQVLAMQQANFLISQLAADLIEDSDLELFY